MIIDTIFTAKEVIDYHKENKNVAVIDVFRATSVIVTAFYHGVKYIKPFKTVEEARRFKDSEGAHILLGGERNREKIEGFDFGNSPLEYRDVKDKILSFTTTNGTLALENAIGFENIYILSFLNLNRVCDELIKRNKDIVFACSGTKGKFTMDDTICAGFAINYIQSKADVRLTDASIFARNYCEKHDYDVRRMLENTEHYERLMSSGYEKDVEYALQLNKHDILPYYDGEFIRI